MAHPSKSGPLYGKVRRTLWNDPYFRNLELHDKIIYLYLTTCQHAHMSGLYALSLVTAADDLLLSIEEVERSIEGPLKRVVQYDRVAREVYVRGCGIVQVQPELSADDKIVLHVVKHLAGIHSEPLKAAFLADYGEAWSLTTKAPSQAPTEAPSKPLGKPVAVAVTRTGAKTAAVAGEETAADDFIIALNGERQRRADREEASLDSEFEGDPLEAAKLLAIPGRVVQLHDWILEGGEERRRWVVGLRSAVDRGDTEWKRGELFRSTKVFDTVGLRGQAESAYWRDNVPEPITAASS